MDYQIEGEGGNLRSQARSPREKGPLNRSTETGLEAIERLRFLASFPLPGTGKRVGGKKRNLSIASLPTPLGQRSPWA